MYIISNIHIGFAKTTDRWGFGPVLPSDFADLQHLQEQECQHRRPDFLRAAKRKLPRRPDQRSLRTVRNPRRRRCFHQHQIHDPNLRVLCLVLRRGTTTSFHFIFLKKMSWVLYWIRRRGDVENDTTFELTWFTVMSFLGENIWITSWLYYSSEYIA